MGSGEGEPSINARGIGKSKAQICGSVEVGGGLALFFAERTLEGSVAALWMLKSPATRYGCSRSQKADLGETE